MSKRMNQAIREKVIEVTSLPEDWDFGIDSDVQYTTHQCGTKIFVTITKGRDCDDLPPDVTQIEMSMENRKED